MRQTDESDVDFKPLETPFQLEHDYEAVRNEIKIIKGQLKITWLEVSKNEAEMRPLKKAAAVAKELSDAEIEELETRGIIMFKWCHYGQLCAILLCSLLLFSSLKASLLLFKHTIRYRAKPRFTSTLIYSSYWIYC